MTIFAIRALAWTALAAALSAAPCAYALTATQSVLKEVRTQDATGEVRTDYVEADLVTPGETVLYRLDYHNDADEPVTDMVLTMPVPAEVEYRDGSALREGTTLLFSADGGESFAARDAVTPAGEDERIAEAGEITHVRWVFDSPLAPGATGDIAFAGRLR